MHNKEDIVLSQTTKRMADTLPAWMSARSNYITDKYVTENSTGSNWQKFVNTIAMQIDELRSAGLAGCNATLTVPDEIDTLYVVGTPSDVYEIDSVYVYKETNLTFLAKCEYIWDFYYGSPINYEYTAEEQLLYINLSNVACGINYVTVDSADVTYMKQDFPSYTKIIFSEPVNAGQVIRVSFRTYDCYYHDRLNHTLFLRKQYDNVGTGNVFINANNIWYPNEKNLNNGYLPHPKRYYNVLDSLGLLCDIPRLENENDSSYKVRLCNAYIYRPDANIAGIRNVVANRLGFIQSEEWKDDRKSLSLTDIWPDSVTVDNKYLDCYKLKHLGMSLKNDTILSSVRVFRNGDLKRYEDDYTISNSVISFKRNVEPTENILVDYLLPGVYYKPAKYSIPTNLVNGVDYVFNIPAHISNTLEVYKGGFRLSSAKDYTEKDGAIEFKEPPLSDDGICIKYYNLSGSRFSFEKKNFDNVNGSEMSFDFGTSFSMIDVFKNGLYMYEGYDYNVSDNNINFVIAPEQGSNIELQATIFGAQSKGGIYEQIQFSNNIDGGVIFNVGNLNSSAKYETFEILLQYLGENPLSVNDIYVSSYITSSTEYATEKKYANERTYIDTDSYSDYIVNKSYKRRLVPERYGWREYKADDPGTLYGFNPEVPKLEIFLDYYNLTNVSSDLMKNGDVIRCQISCRNSGELPAEDVLVVVYTTQFIELNHFGGGVFELVSLTPRAMSHNVKYIKTNRWNDTRDSINVYPLHDKYYINKFMMVNGQPTDELKKYAKTINDVVKNMWDNGKWDRSYWTKYEHIYGDIDENSNTDIKTLNHFIKSVSTNRFNYSYLPHFMDTGTDQYAQTEIDINRRLEFRSGIGNNEQLMASINTDEYFNSAGYLHYTFPVYVNNGYAYLNDVATYQFGKEKQIYYYNQNEDTCVNVPNIEVTRVLIFDGTISKEGRKTCFFNDDGSTHEKTEVLYGNGINNTIKTEFTDINLKKLYYNDEEIPGVFYSVTDNCITLVEGSPGVSVTSDKELVIETDCKYTAVYELNNSYYIDMYGYLFVNVYEATVIVSYDSADKFRTGILANPMYSPHTQKFVYADIFEPEPNSISSWISPNCIKANSGEPVFVTVELLDKHGTPCSGKLVTFTGIETNTMYTNQFGRCVYIFNAPSTSKTITVTCGDLSDQSVIEVY